MRPCSSRFSRAVSWSSSEGSWKTSPIRDRTAAGSCETSIPATCASPEVGRSSVQRMLIVVVLPAPLGPRKPKTSPCSTARSIPRTASMSPYVFTRPLTSITAATALFPERGRGLALADRIRAASDGHLLQEEREDERDPGDDGRVKEHVVRRRGQRPTDRQQELRWDLRGGRGVEDRLRVPARGDRTSELGRNGRRDLLRQLVREHSAEDRDAHGAPDIPPELDLARDHPEVSHVDGALRRVEVEGHADTDAEPDEDQIAHHFDLGRADVHLREEPEADDHDGQPDRAEKAIALNPHHELAGDDACGDQPYHQRCDEQPGVRRWDPENPLIDEAHVQDRAEHREPEEEADDGGHRERRVPPELEGHDGVRVPNLDREEDHAHHRGDREQAEDLG